MFSVKSFALILTFYYCAVLLISVEAGGERAPELQGREAEPRRPCRVGAGETHGGDGAAPRGVQKDQPGTRGMWGMWVKGQGVRVKGQGSTHVLTHEAHEARMSEREWKIGFPHDIKFVALFWVQASLCTVAMGMTLFLPLLTLFSLFSLLIVHSSVP